MTPPAHRRPSARDACDGDGGRSCGCTRPTLACFVELVDNALAIPRDDRYMTDLTVPPLGPDPDDPEDQHLALISALIKIFAADRDDKD